MRKRFFLLAWCMLGCGAAATPAETGDEPGASGGSAGIGLDAASPLPREAAAEASLGSGGRVPGAEAAPSTGGSSGGGGATGAGGSTQPLPGDVEILMGKSNGSYTWVGSGAVITTSGGTALPTSKDAEGHVVLDIDVTAAPANSGWGAGIQLPATSDISKPGAVLELLVQGRKGGESIQVGFQDAAGASVRREISDFGTVTTSWQTIRIPVSDLTTSMHGGTFNATSVGLLILFDWPADVLQLSMKQIRVTSGP